MPQRRTEDAEPRADATVTAFTEGDFHALSSACARDPQYNDRRLELRRKLASLAKVFAARAERESRLQLDTRTSLHNPHAFNQMQVKRMWAYACRNKKEKSRLKQTIGADLAKDLDAAYRNAFLCVAVESEALEVSLRVHADAWYDGQNLVNRVRKEGVDAWKSVLNELEGFRLRLADWKGEWVCGALGREKLEEFLKYYKPGEHALVVERKFAALPGTRGEAISEAMPMRLVDELTRLVPLYRFAAWSQESDYLFAR
jgi:hypothetical protein